jgi:hypothetical protein
MPVTQGNAEPENPVPSWRRRIPNLLNWTPLVPNRDFQLIDAEGLEAILVNQDPVAAQRVRHDIKTLEYALGLFREVDSKAKQSQIEHRRFQLMYILLGVLATLIGSLLTLTLDREPTVAAFLSFLEMVIAASTGLLSTISNAGNESPFQRWMQNRLRAEYLRREYFRYLMNLQPYTDLDEVRRQASLEQRAAAIYSGKFPDTPSELMPNAPRPQG